METFFSNTKTVTVAVTIPIYKPKPSELETIALAQCLQVLRNYPIIFFHPASMDFSFYQDFSTKYATEAHFTQFEDIYFKNIQGYNALLVSTNFYHRFQQFRYILIYQLDAFVFKDELQEWCVKNYDYIGSPWIYDEFVQSYNGIHAPLWSIAHWRKKINYGGNGGLSLRKIKSFLRFLKTFPKVARNYEGNEDGFWSFYTDWYNPFFKVAPANTALHFAFEKNPEQSFQRTQKKLPFGCHAWHKYNTAFWQPHIENFGHQLHL